MSTPIQNDRLLRALRCEAVDRPPIWLMRQAGRYLPEYRATRAKAGSFLKLCMTPELACEVTLQPVDRFGFDAAILFSDILTVPNAMGLGLHFTDGEGPAFEHPLRDVAAIDRLGVPDPETELRYVMDAVRTVKGTLAGRVPLIGFAGSPWTLATYMIEGRGSRDFRYAKALRFDDPAALQRLLATLVDAVGQYLAAQAAAGADVLMLFDSWGGALDAPGYRKFSLVPMQRIIAHLAKAAPGVPVILFSKGCNGQLAAQAQSGATCIGVDWTIELAQARQTVGPNVALQGNLDPVALFARPEQVQAEVRRVLASHGRSAGHVFNLGHGILQHTPIESVHALVEAVHSATQDVVG
ncbi:MAG: uroporphyrinogen decarboxylase [Nevskiaceae bacterium]|nr:MAG: uroporphyrinogen decarboxylase [Nevskiaceae bacterium]TBR72510.1 MAG: uroporphyrinogen decarboxylase [Nevskiaceae bacterium]